LLILVGSNDGQQPHQYQQNYLPLSNDGQQLHQYQQNYLPLSSDGQQPHQYQQNYRMMFVYFSSLVLNVFVLMFVTIISR
jgi:hypothetical protein